MSRAVRALRGATTIDADTEEQVDERVIELLAAMFDRNDVHHDDIISIFFTTTPDIGSRFPATAARAFGLGDVALLGAQEQAVEGAPSLVIRVLAHIDSDRSRDQLHHVYLHRAATLRDDLSP